MINTNMSSLRTYISQETQLSLANRVTALGVEIN